MKQVVVYDKTSGIVKNLLPAVCFTSGKDNIGRYCGELNDRLIFCLETKSFKIKHPTELMVKRDHSSGNGSFKVIHRKTGQELNIYDESHLGGKPLIIDCDIFSGTGYGMLSREFMKRMIESKLPFKIKPLDATLLFQSCLSESDNIFASHLIKSKDMPKPEDYIHMRIYPPRINFPRKYYNLAYTMLESYSLNHFYMKMMEGSFDKFIVPTYFIERMFSQYISKDRLSVVPLGIDPNTFHTNIVQEDVRFKKVDLHERKIEWTEDKPSGFRFLSTSRFSHRKGCDLVLKSFAETFDRKKDDVSLVLFYLPENEGAPQHMLSRIIKILSAYDISKIPPIYISDQVRPTNKQHVPYAWGDCFVLPSRGEGFGLTPLEAAGCGLPVIASNSSGLSDFIDDSSAFVVPVDKVDDIGNLESGKYVGKYPEWTQDFLHPHV